MFRGLICVCAVTFATAAAGAEKPSAADAIAQKFAEQSQPAPAPDTPSKTTPNAAKSPAVPKAEPAKIERPPLDYEIEMLRRARAEQAGAKGAPAAAPTAAAAIATPPATIQKAEQTAPATAPAAPAAATVSPAATTPAAVAAPPIAPAKAAEVAAPPPPKTEVQAKVDPKPSEPAKAAETAAAPAARASLLLAIETSGASSKDGAAPTYDPLICMGDTCFMSAGLNADAVKLTKLDALKLKTTTEASPDSVREKWLASSAMSRCPPAHRCKSSNSVPRPMILSALWTRNRIQPAN